MRKIRKIRVALVGLGFGAEFVPIYIHHPNVEYLALCDTDSELLAKIGDKFQIKRLFNSLQQIINSDEYHAVHLVTPIPVHAEQTIAVLESGKHCACTVPMTTTIEDIEVIIIAQRKAKKNYMMMETSVYARTFLFVKDMFERGALGRIQLVRGAHYQDMENWPPYWMGLPPMHYGTHAISPLLALLRTRAIRVYCLGSGQMREELRQQYENPYPIETAIFQLNETDVVAEVTRSLFHTARGYTESFNIYGEKATFEWQQIEKEKPVLFKMGPLRHGRGRLIKSKQINIPDRQDLLPKEIRRFTQIGVYDESNPHTSFLQGGGHGGSHPHLVDEFIRSIIEERPPYIDAITAANWTAPGICAHESAMRYGKPVMVPKFK